MKEVTERLQFPMLNHDDGTVEQLAHRIAAQIIAHEVNRLEDEGRLNGWESLYRAKSEELAHLLRRLADDLYAAGTVGLEARVVHERERMRGFPCPKCGHQHEGSRYSFRCFNCNCAESAAHHLNERSTQNPK